VHATKAYGEAEIYLHSFLTSTSNWGELPASRPDRFKPLGVERYRVHDSLHTPSQINPVHVFMSFLFNNFRPSPHLSLGLPSYAFPSDFPTNILHVFQFSPILLWAPPISSRCRFQAGVCGHPFVGIANSNCGCCVLSGRGLCDEPISLPEDSYRLWWLLSWSRNLKKSGEKSKLWSSSVFDLLLLVLLRPKCPPPPPQHSVLTQPNAAVPSGLGK
jgi:hypothetical protein